MLSAVSRILPKNKSSDRGHIHRFPLPYPSRFWLAEARTLLSSTSTRQILSFISRCPRRTVNRNFKELTITVELENCVDLRNGFGTILICRVTKDLCLGSIANDHILLYGPDLDGLFENRASWGKLLDPTEKQLMGYRRQRDDHRYIALFEHGFIRFVVSK